MDFGNACPAFPVGPAVTKQKKKDRAKHQGMVFFSQSTNQPHFSCKRSLSAIMEINSLFVGFPLIWETVYPK